MRVRITSLCGLSLLFVGCTRPVAPVAVTDLKGATHELSAAEIPQTDAEWRAFLSPEQYEVLREEGTEAPFTSPLNEEKRKGTYVSADCGEPLFRSEQKYDSGTGWPSFYAPISDDVLELKTDMLLGYERTEVRTKKCGGHLGHVFNDGPPPTGLRYCMNGLALKFIPDTDQPSSSSAL